ncbi:hypothetical protein K438DRAFT_527703 [Mycena galopus ATCC 62051]|nr:hypothetical protein K438DRAFT_527703 [Mycena galopus ATCC 62051]
MIQAENGHLVVTTQTQYVLVRLICGGVVLTVFSTSSASVWNPSCRGVVGSASAVVSASVSGGEDDEDANDASAGSVAVDVNDNDREEGPSRDAGLSIRTGSTFAKGSSSSMSVNTLDVVRLFVSQSRPASDGLGCCRAALLSFRCLGVGRDLMSMHGVCGVGGVWGVGGSFGNITGREEGDMSDSGAGAFIYVLLAFFVTRCGVFSACGGRGRI